MSKTLKRILIIAIVVIALILVGVFLGKGTQKGEKVVVEKAMLRTIEETVTASGKVYPEVEVKISPDISGQITELNVEEGDSVKRGQVLAKIYADIYALQRDQAASQVSQSVATVENSRAALDALKANLDQADQVYNRNKKLFDQKIISKSELEQFETNLASTKANYNAAQQNIKSLQAGVIGSQTGLSKANKDFSRTTIVATMDGVVSSLSVKKGESVSGNSFTVGTEMLRIADMSIIEVRVNVSENDIAKVEIGDSADVEVDAYNSRKFKGVVTKIASSTTGSGGAALGATNDVTNYEVRIRLDKSSYTDLSQKTFPFRPGMNASADIKTVKHENVLTVPIAAVTTRPKGAEKPLEKTNISNEDQDEEAAKNAGNASADGLDELVFVLQANNKVKKVLVKSGIQDINYIEVLSGLKQGDQVIVRPYTAISKILVDGMEVKVVKESELFEKKK